VTTSPPHTADELRAQAEIHNHPMIRDETVVSMLRAGADAMERVKVLEEALKLAATWFEEYATQHYAKARTAPDGGEQHGREVKGKANADRAKVLRAALEKP
jgi:hypothetical protein